jgi:hypothetical protein
MAGRIRQGALHACIATLRPDALDEMWISGRSGIVRPGCTTALTLETVSSSMSKLTYMDAIWRRKFRAW